LLKIFGSSKPIYVIIELTATLKVLGLNPNKPKTSFRGLYIQTRSLPNEPNEVEL